MSEVRCCDQCGTHFSVNEKGWSSGQMGTPVEKNDGTVVTRSVQIDICGECNQGAFKGRGTAERNAIASGVKPSVVDEVSRRTRQEERIGRYSPETTRVGREDDTGTDPRHFSD